MSLPAGFSITSFGYDPYEDMLKHYHADTTSHTGRTLMDHLKGVRDLLKAWEMPEYVCVAGLFHSIYSTNIFTVQSASFEDREVIEVMIGKQAERLAYLFCVSERPDAFFEAMHTNRILNRHTGEVEVVKSFDVLDLVVLEVANHIEQDMGAHLVAKIWDKPALSTFMTKNAMNDMRRFMYKHGITR